MLRLSLLLRVTLFSLLENLARATDDTNGGRREPVYCGEPMYYGERPLCDQMLEIDLTTGHSPENISWSLEGPLNSSDCPAVLTNSATSYTSPNTIYKETITDDICAGHVYNFQIKFGENTTYSLDLDGHFFTEGGDFPGFSPGGTEEDFEFEAGWRCGRCDQTLTFSLATPSPNDTTWSFDLSSEAPPTCRDTSVTGGPYGYDGDDGSTPYRIDLTEDDEEGGGIVTFYYTQIIAEHLCAGQEYTFEIEYGLGIYDLLLNGLHIHDGMHINASITGENVTFVVPGQPSMSPTTEPTVSPSGAPSMSPTIGPTVSPSVYCGLCDQMLEIDLTTGNSPENISWSLEGPLNSNDCPAVLTNSCTNYSVPNVIYKETIADDICEDHVYNFQIKFGENTTYSLDLDGHFFTEGGDFPGVTEEDFEFEAPMRCGRCDQTLTFLLTTPLPGDTTWSLDMSSEAPPACKDTSVTGGPYSYDSYDDYDSFLEDYNAIYEGPLNSNEWSIVTFDYTQTIAEYLCAGQEYTFEIEYGMGFYELLLNGVYLHRNTNSIGTYGESVTFVVEGQPSMSPTTGPTVSPSGAPSMSPTMGPTVSPSGAPTTQPSTGSPSTSPTIACNWYCENMHLNLRLDLSSNTNEPELGQDGNCGDTCVGEIAADRNGDVWPELYLWANGFWSGGTWYSYEDRGMPSGEFEICMSQCFPEEDSGDGKPDPGSVVIIVPVVIGAVFLAAGAYAVARKRKTAVAQRRLSHRAASIPSVLAE